MYNDLRFALRQLRKNPGFTAVAVLTLALGIGANTAIFSIVNTVLLRPLPYKDPGQLVMVFERLEKVSPAPVEFSPPDFLLFEREQKIFTEVAAFANKQYELSSAAAPERIAGARVSPSLFSVLGVLPAIGRTFTRDEDRPGHDVVVLSARLWRRKFGADPGVLGTSIRLERRPYIVIGIMPEGFEFPHRGPARNNEPADLWLPLAFTPEEREAWTSRYNHSVLARLKPGVTLTQARLEATSLARRIQQEFYPPDFRSGGPFVLNASVEPFQAEVAGRTRNLLLILQGAVALVLLIACTDVANLLLTRSAARQQEMVIRSALGAGRFRLVRQLLCESLPLALLGGLLGLLITRWAIDLVVNVSRAGLPRAAEIRIDATVLLFTLFLCCSGAFLFGLAPALQASRCQTLGETLKENTRAATPASSRQRLVGLFVIAQFAMGLVLLTAAGLLIRSFTHLLRTDPGFRPESVLSLSLSLPQTGYQAAASIRSFYARLLERLETLPGVKAVGAATDLPLAVRERRAFSIENPPAATKAVSKPVANVWVFGNYFEVLGIRLKSGRFLTPQDGLSGVPVIVINQTLSRRYFPDQDPLGQRIKSGSGGTSRWMTIVGVVEDVKHGSLRTEVIPQTFEPYYQVSDQWMQDTTMGMLRSLSVMVRTNLDPNTLAAAVRNEIRALDPELPVVNVQTLEQYVRASVSAERFNALALAILAAVALFLAAIGVYGVLSYSVTQRTHEIGVRIALGARASDVVRLVLTRGMKLAGLGIALGVLVSLALMQVLRSLLYGVTARDPATFAAVAFSLGAVALLACYIPARRATKVDPMEALRYE